MIDAKLVFSTDQDLGDTPADQASTNVLDCGAQETALGEEEHLRLVISVSEAFNDDNAADDSTYAFNLQDCATVGGSYTSIAQTKALPAPDMPLGVLWDIGLPTVHKRYLKVHYEYTTGTGDIDAGMVNAYITAR